MIAASGGGVLPPIPLPTGYTALIAVESPLGNTAYLNTGITTGANVGFEIDALSYDSFSSTAGAYGCLFGGRSSSNVADFQLSTYRSNSSWAGTFRRGRSGQNYNAHLPSSGTRFKASLEGNTYTIDGSSYTTAQNISASRNIYLFALNNNNSAAQHGHARVYRFKLTDNGTLVLDYVPCRRDADSVVGFYDLVAEAFVPPTSGTLTGVL